MKTYLVQRPEAVDDLKVLADGFVIESGHLVLSVGDVPMTAFAPGTWGFVAELPEEEAK